MKVKYCLFFKDFDLTSFISLRNCIIVIQQTYSPLHLSVEMGPITTTHLIFS